MNDEMFSKQEYQQWTDMHKRHHKAHKNTAEWEKWEGFGQARRGDIGPIVLKALSTKPMHGYEIIQYFEEKTQGLWKPSPGSVYPTLQMLEEQDLVTADQKGGKKVYTITKAGQAAAEASETEIPWEGKNYYVMQLVEFRQLFKEFKDIFKQIIKSGSEDKIKKTKKILESTRDELAEIACEK